MSLEALLARCLTRLRDGASRVREVLMNYEDSVTHDALDSYLRPYGLPGDAAVQSDAARKLREEVDRLLSPEVLEVPKPQLPPILIFGGIAVEEKRKAFAEYLGRPVVWGSDDDTRNSAERHKYATQIRNHAYAGVILLQELLSHAQWSTLVEASKLSGTPYSAAGKGGIGALKRAAGEIGVIDETD